MFYKRVAKHCFFFSKITHDLINHLYNMKRKLTVKFPNACLKL